MKYVVKKAFFFVVKFYSGNGMRLLKHLFILTLLFSLIQVPSAASEEKILALMSARVRPYLDVLEGFKDEVDYKVKTLVISEIKNFDAAEQIRKIKPTMVLAIGMGALEYTKNATNLPIVYTMVLNPESVIDGKKNITGVSLNIAPHKFLRAIRDIVPDLKRVGLTFDPRKSISMVEETWFSAKSMGIKLTARKAYLPENVPGIISKMSKKMDVYLMLQDLTVTSPETVKFLMESSFKDNFPVFAFSSKYAVMGALASLQTDEFDIGKQAAAKAKKIFSGTNPEDVPQSPPRKVILTINLKTAKKLGISISKDVIKTGRVIR